MVVAFVQRPISKSEENSHHSIQTNAENTRTPDGDAHFRQELGYIVLFPAHTLSYQDTDAEKRVELERSTNTSGNLA